MDEMQKGVCAVCGKTKMRAIQQSCK